MLEQRSLTILELILGNPNLTIKDLQLKTTLTRRQVLYSLEKVNFWLREHQFEEIEYCRNNGLRVKETPNNVLQKLAQEKAHFIYNEKERQMLLFFYLLIASEEVSSYHLTDLLEVSRGTINEDLKKLSKELSLYNLQITYKRVYGYFLDGEEADVRYASMYLIGSLISNYKRHKHMLDYVLNKNGVPHDQLFQMMRQFFEEEQIKFSDNGLSEVIYIIIFFIARKRYSEEQRQYHMKITNTLEFCLAKKTCAELSKLGYPITECCIDFIASLILAYSMGNADSKDESYHLLRNFVYKIFQKLEVIYGISLANKYAAFQQIYAHFKPAYYRIIFNYPIVNPLKDKIKAKYNVLFKVLRDIFYPISLPGGSRFSDNEIAYLTIHFATLIKQTKVQSTKKIKAGIVCPNGTGISLIIYKELKSIFPELEFLKPTSVEQMKTIIHKVDVLFSTNLIQTTKPLFIVSPIMTNLEKANLIKRFYHSIGSSVYINQQNKVDEKDLISIVKKYTNEQSAKKIIYELKKQWSENIYIDDERRQPMLSEIINKDLIQLNVIAKNWRDAIKKSSQPLVSQDIITPQYVEAMIDSAENNGPYIVITKHVALPHARPEEGALQIGISLTTLKTPVAFGNKDNDPVKYVFCLSATDSITHLKAITELVELLELEEFYELIDQTNNGEEIIDFIKKTEMEMRT